MSAAPGGEIEQPVWLGLWRHEAPDTYKRRCIHRGDVWDAVLYRWTNTATGTEAWRKRAVLIGSTNAPRDAS